MVELLYKFPGGPIAFQIFAAVAVVALLRWYWMVADRKAKVKAGIKRIVEDK